MTIFNNYELLAKQSIVDGEQKLTEDQVRSMMGAPSREEEEICTCGDPIDTCPDSYVHMTQGV
jgi:hypothetical protein